MRDQHFSIVSSYLKKIQHLKRLTNVKEICDALNNYQEQSNRWRKADKNKKTSDNPSNLPINRKKILKGLPINFLAVIIPTKTEKIAADYLEINRMESLYNIKNVKKVDNKNPDKYQFVLKTSVFSDLNQEYSINSREAISAEFKNMKGHKPKQLSSSVPNIDY